MKAKTFIVNDPDFGPVDLPAVPVRRSDWNKFRQRLHAKLKAASPWKPGVAYRCGQCGERALFASSDLTQEVRRGQTLVVLRNLRGAECRSCGAGLLDLAEALRIDAEFDAIDSSPSPARVSRVGRGTVGTYWPKAIERAVGLRPGTRLTIHVLSPKSLLLHVGRRRTSSRAPRQVSKPRRG